MGASRGMELGLIAGQILTYFLDFRCYNTIPFQVRFQENFKRFELVCKHETTIGFFLPLFLLILSSSSMHP